MHLYSEQFKLGSANVGLAVGDLTWAEADAYIVPQTQNYASDGGVGAAISSAGAEKGVIDEYERYRDLVSRDGRQLPYGHAFVTPSHGGKARKLIHVISVGSGRKNEFRVVQESVYNALCAARDHSIGTRDEPIRTIICPVLGLGSGIMGTLTDEQSARAMLSAVNRFQKMAPEDAATLKISFVAHGHPDNEKHRAFQAMKRVLESGSYVEELDAVRWAKRIAMRLRPLPGSYAGAEPRSVQSGEDDASVAAARPVGTRRVTTRMRKGLGD